MFESNNDEFLGLAWRDLLWNMVSAVTLILVMMIPLIAIQQSKQNTDQEGSINQDNMIIVEIRWPDHYCDDVDLWLMAPNEEKPIGFSNRGGRTMDLLRDDLGCSSDGTNINYETQFSRGIPDGEYIVNVQLYNKTSVGDVPVNGAVTLRRPKSTQDSALDGKKMSEQLVVREIMLKQDDEEQTLFRFRMKGGSLVPGSVNNNFKSIFQKNDVRIMH